MLVLTGFNERLQCHTVKCFQHNRRNLIYINVTRISANISLFSMLIDFMALNIHSQLKSLLWILITLFNEFWKLSIIITYRNITLSKRVVKIQRIKWNCKHFISKTVPQNVLGNLSWKHVWKDLNKVASVLEPVIRFQHLSADNGRKMAKIHFDSCYIIL